MSVASAPGTGTITLGSAQTGYQSFTAAGVGNGSIVSYLIEDTGGAWEVGQGTYTVSGATLARSTIQGSSNGGSAINATTAAVVSITALASDFVGGSGLSPNVKQVALTTSFTTTSASPVDVTGYNISITPTSATSRVRLSGAIKAQCSDGSAVLAYNLVRVSTVIDTGRTLIQTNSLGFNIIIPLSYIDNPSTNSSINYKIQIWIANGASASISVSNSAAFGASTLIAEEIGS